MSNNRHRKGNMKKWDKKKARPPWCYKKDSKVIYSIFDKQSHIDGCSSFCFGKMKEVQSFKENITVHENDICQCYYTPLKGAILFLTNKDDIWADRNAIDAVLKRLALTEDSQQLATQDKETNGSKR